MYCPCMIQLQLEQLIEKTLYMYIVCSYVSSDHMMCTLTLWTLVAALG